MVQRVRMLSMEVAHTTAIIQNKASPFIVTRTLKQLQETCGQSGSGRRGKNGRMRERHGFFVGLKCADDHLNNGHCF